MTPAVDIKPEWEEVFRGYVERVPTARGGRYYPIVVAVAVPPSDMPVRELQRQYVKAEDDGQDLATLANGGEKLKNLYGAIYELADPRSN